MNNNIVPMDEGGPIEIIYSDSDDDLPPPLIENNEPGSEYVPNDYYAEEAIFFTNNDQQSPPIENNEYLTQVQAQGRPNHLIIGQASNMSQRISDYLSGFELNNEIFNSSNNIPTNTLNNYGQTVPTMGGVAINNANNNNPIGLSRLLQQQMAFNLQHKQNNDGQSIGTTTREHIQSLAQNYNNDNNYNNNNNYNNDDNNIPNRVYYDSRTGEQIPRNNIFVMEGVAHSIERRNGDLIITDVPGFPITSNLPVEEATLIHDSDSDDELPELVDSDMPELTLSVNTASIRQFYGEHGQPPQQ
jgi:hypothetical protein